MNMSQPDTIITYQEFSDNILTSLRKYEIHETEEMGKKEKMQ